MERSNVYLGTTNAWCPTCRMAPGEPCMMTNEQSKTALAAAAAQREPPRPRGMVVIDASGLLAHRSRVGRADALLSARVSSWRRDELERLVRTLLANGALERAEAVAT